jgi:hypothetical protein
VARGSLSSNTFTVRSGDSLRGHISGVPSSSTVLPGIVAERHNWGCSLLDIECSRRAPATMTYTGEPVVLEIAATPWDTVSVLQIGGVGDMDSVVVVGLVVCDSVVHASDTSTGYPSTLGVVDSASGLKAPAASASGLKVPTALHTSGSGRRPFTFHQAVFDSGHGSSDTVESLSPTLVRVCMPLTDSGQGPFLPSTPVSAMHTNPVVSLSSDAVTARSGGFFVKGLFQ